MKRVPMGRTRSLRAKNPKRKAENFARAYGSPERVAWVRGQPCVACGWSPSENAHVRTGGTSRKADAHWIAPICPACHGRLHLVGKASFEAAHHIDLDHEAALTDARWAQYEAAHRKTPPTTPPEGEGVKE